MPRFPASLCPLAGLVFLMKRFGCGANLGAGNAAAVASAKRLEVKPS